jgi:hypothetical protein
MGMDNQITYTIHSLILDYVNLKSNERIHRYDPVRDSLSQPCIVDSIDYFSCAVTDQEEQIMKSQEALSFLTHNLADLHQPLHVCEKGTWLQYNFLMNSLDRIKERFLFWKKKNVDSWRYLRLPFSQRLAWDTLIVEQRVSKMKSLDEYVDYLEGLFPLINRPYADMIQRHTSSYLDMAVQWANETAQLNHIVWDVNSKDLKNGYSEQVGDVVDLQLARAGIRTAAVMNSLSEQVHVYQGPFLQSESIYPAFTQKALLALKATQEAKDNTQLSCLSFNE